MNSACSRWVKQAQNKVLVIILMRLSDFSQGFFEVFRLLRLNDNKCAVNQ